MREFLALLVMALIVEPLAAAVVVTHEPVAASPPYLIATGIQGLEVNGTAYDVEFLGFGGTFDSIFGTGDPPAILPTFLFDSAGAAEAAAEIASLLNVPNIYTAGPFPNDSNEIAIPFQLTPANSYRAIVIRSIPDWPYSTGGWTIHYSEYLRDQRTVSIVRFRELEASSVPVPEPPSIAGWVFLVGGLAGVRRLSKHVA